MVTNKPSQFSPIKKILLYRSEKRNEVWARMILDRKDKDVVSTIKHLEKKRAFKALFHKVVSENVNEYWYETKSEYGRMKGLDTAIRSISSNIKKFGVFTILTHGGYRFYLPIFNTINVPQLAIAYALIFYLGSITRYKPDVFDKILVGGYSWLVAEYLATHPMQFLYMLASELAGVDVVRPYAVEY